MSRAARKWIIRSALALSVLAALSGLALTVLLRTTAGAGWTLEQVNTRLAGDINYDGLDGNLWNGLQVQRASYTDSGQKIEATGLRVVIDWSTLNLDVLPLASLSAETLRYRSPTPKVATPLEVAMEPLSIRLEIEHGDIAKASLLNEGAMSAIENVQWSGFSIVGRTLRAERISAAAAGFQATGREVEISLVDEAPISADLEWKSLDDAWSGSGPLRGSLKALNFEQAVAGPYPGKVTGTMQWLGRLEPEFDTIFQWDAWRFDTLEVRQGRVRTTGVPEAYQAEYNATVQAEGSMEAAVTGTANGHLEGLDAFEARLQGDAGTATLKGALSWLPEFSASTHVQVEAFDPVLLHPALSGRIAGQAEATLDAFGQLTLSAFDFSGMLNGSRVKANGDLSYGGGILQCKHCLLLAAENRIAVDGQANADALALTIDVHAPDLEKLWAGLEGSIDARGHLGGSPTFPIFTGTMNGDTLGFGEWSARRASVESRTGSARQLDLDFTLQGLAWGQRELGRLQGTARGRPEQLDLQLDWAIEDTIEASANVKLKQDGNGISGVLQSAEVTEPASGTWSLDSPAEFSFDDGSARIDGLDWTSTRGQLHVTRLSSAQGRASLEAGLDGLPLELFNPFLPGDYRLRGVGSGMANLEFNSGAWTGSLEWRQDGTVLQVEQLDQDVIDIHVPVATIVATLESDGADIAAAVSIDPGVTGQLKLRMDALSTTARVDGVVELQGEDWDWVPAVIPQVDRIQGAMSANFRLSGPLQSPALAGRLSWSDGSLVVPALNVPLTQVNFELEGEPDAAATISGTAQVEGDELKLSGRASNLLRAERTAELHLAGEAAKLLDWPDYHVWGSPNLDLRLVSGNWVIGGSLHVPRAEISVRDIANEAVTPSPDVTVIGEEPLAEEITGYSGEVRLVLGEEVRVKAYGLDTRLEGDLTLRQARDRPLRAEGRVTLADGVFEAYGQKLTIKEGTLTFTGPLDNPLVDVRAIRKIDSFSGEIIAGIHLTGRALALNSVVYSEPAMAEAEALSYLVLGQPLSEATSSEGSQLSNAAIGLGLRQANRITGQIGQSVGLDQLSLTSDTGEGTALVAGKQINDRLYARYAYGVFSRLGTLLLRYRLSQRLTLEAGTGETQTIDLLYTVEKK